MKWAWEVAVELGFVIVILRLDTTNGQLERKPFVVLSCEKGSKYRQYKNDTKTITGLENVILQEDH